MILPDRLGLIRMANMMVLPFAFFTAAIFAGWRRHSWLAIMCWLLGMAATLAMFRYHVSSSLDLAF
jgi:hypothetical protein